MKEEIKDEEYDSPSPTREEQDADEEDKDNDDYESDEDDDFGGVTIKGASQYLAYQPREKK